MALACLRVTLKTVANAVAAGPEPLTLVGRADSSTKVGTFQPPPRIGRLELRRQHFLFAALRGRVGRDEESLRLRSDLAVEVQRQRVRSRRDGVRTARDTAAHKNA